MMICVESVVLAIICTLDMLSTAWLVRNGIAKEANPIMQFYLDSGIYWFVFFKVLLYAAPIFVLELLRRRRPRSIRHILRLGVVLYLATYGLGVWQSNQPTSPQPLSETERGESMH